VDSSDTSDGHADPDALDDGPRPDTHRAILDAVSFEAIVAHEDEREGRYRRPTTMVVLELDGLERLVDRLGTGAAEKIEPDVADTIAKLARRADYVARLAPGRYAVLMPETDEIVAINYVERIRQACDEWLESGAIAMRLAIGLGEHGRQRVGDDGDAGRDRPDASRGPALRAPCRRRHDRGIADRLSQSMPSRIARPGVAPVCSPSRTTSVPLTMTWSMPRRKPSWLVVRGVAPDGLGVEHDEIGQVAIADRAALPKTESRRRGTGHLSDRLLQAEQALVSDELAEDPRIGAVRPRARLGADERRVGPHHPDRMLDEVGEAPGPRS
jgi:diguanylate cyclase (GGDEF)-like protein